MTLTKLTAEGLGRVPRKGPLIVVSNHLHLADPPLLGALIPRHVHFMAKTELFESFWGGLFARSYGAFPVRRGLVDRTALRQAEAILKSGGVVGMFPEGHRSHGEGLLPGLPGVALIARLANAPLLPVAIAGTEAVFRVRPPWTITVRIGDPFLLSDESAGGRSLARRRPLEEDTEEIMMRIAELLPAAYRGAYASKLATDCPASSAPASARRPEGMTTL